MRMSAHSYSAYEQNHALAPLLLGQMKKSFRSFLSTPVGIDYYKKPFHATVPLKLKGVRNLLCV